MDRPISLFVDVPFCSFRPFLAREYQESFRFPPPSTVYGMLLSLVGIEWGEKAIFQGIRLCLAIQGEPSINRVLRKFRRVPQQGEKDELAERRPDYQDVISGLKLWIWLDDYKAKQSLSDYVLQALSVDKRKTISRYGGLCLGESSNLINEIRIDEPEGSGRYLVNDENGFLVLTTWVNHPREGKGRTVKKRFSVTEICPLEMPPREDRRWTYIASDDS
ncbi:MAG: type I-MYXAN CRISPR-associated protein Cas5/Cmx5/DevS [Nitrososphaerota archaeon]